MSEHVKLPKDEVYALKRWREIIEAQYASDIEKGEFAGLETISDNVALYAYYFKKHGDETLSIDNLRMMRACQLWDRILPAGGAYKWWEKHPSPLITEEMVADRMFSPPRSRASRRATILAMYSIDSINWNTWTNTRGTTRSLGDAY